MHPLLRCDLPLWGVFATCLWEDSDFQWKNNILKLQLATSRSFSHTSMGGGGIEMEKKTLVEVRLATSRGGLGIRLDKNLFKLFLPLRDVFWHMSLEGHWFAWIFFLLFGAIAHFEECFGVFRTCPWRAKNISMEKHSFEQGREKNEHALFIAKLYL